jgi:hypothetical protein
MRGGDSRFIFCMDPIGESLLFSELLDNQWHIYEYHDLVILMLDNIVAHLKSIG